MDCIHEAARQTPIAYNCDCCVIGGSATGVFAAVRAARLGLRVALVEQNAIFGGMATAGQVNEWHRLTDAFDREPIIGGLTAEVLEQLQQRAALHRGQRPHRGEYVAFNSAELCLALDRLVRAHDIRPFLKATCVAAAREGDRIAAAIIEDKSGRRAIRARIFIDASGDGDLLRRAGFAAWQQDGLQPVMYQMLAAGLNGLQRATNTHPWKAVADLAARYGHPVSNSPWLNDYPCPADVRNVYSPRQHGIDASDGDQLTAAILEGRRMLDALLDMLRERFGNQVSPLSFASSLGIRETWHARCRQRIRSEDLLSGRACADSIGRGTYPVDVHSSEGTLLRHLDGNEEFDAADGQHHLRRWRDEGDLTPYYHIPYASLLPEQAENLLVAGRLLDADREAYGALRVMVNCNQTGEAAGCAAWLAIDSDRSPAAIDRERLRSVLAEGGSLMG